jgi:cyanophycinase
MKKTPPRSRDGNLIVIGGHEDKEGDCTILREVAQRVGGGKLVIATVASHEPAGYFESYKKAFSKVGLKNVAELYVDDRAQTNDPNRLKLLEEAAGVFFSGGDQLRISSQIGDTPFENHVRRIFGEGGVIAGTSAGASALAEIMLVRGASGESHRIGDLHMAPGLSLIRDVIIDQHFAERGRIGRLLGAIALNPRLLGIGIDEDTAIVVQGRTFRVIGSGAVYVAEGTGASHSNIADAQTATTLSLFDVHLHVMSSGDCFDLNTRRPTPAAVKGNDAHPYSEMIRSGVSRKKVSQGS